MKKLFLFVIVALAMFTSCETPTKEVMEYRTEISGVQSSLNLRERPSMSANVVTTLRNGTEVTVIGTNDSWKRIKVKYSGYEGWVKSKYVARVQHWVSVKLTVAERFEKAGSPAVSSIIEWFDDAYDGISSNGNKYNDLFWVVMTFVMLWGNAAWMYFGRVNTFHYLIMLIAVGCQFMAFVVCGSEAEIKIPVIFSILLFLAVVTMPVVQWYLTIRLLSYSMDPNYDENTLRYNRKIVIWLIGLLVLSAACGWCIKSIADMVLMVYCCIIVACLGFALVKSYRCGGYSSVFMYLGSYVIFLLPYIVWATFIGVVFVFWALVIYFILSLIFGAQLTTSFVRIHHDGSGFGHDDEGRSYEKRVPMGPWERTE